MDPGPALAPEAIITGRTEERQLQKKDNYGLKEITFLVDASKMRWWERGGPSGQ